MTPAIRAAALVAIEDMMAAAEGEEGNRIASHHGWIAMGWLGEHEDAMYDLLRWLAEESGYRFALIPAPAPATARLALASSSDDAVQGEPEGPTILEAVAIIAAQYPNPELVRDRILTTLAQPSSAGPETPGIDTPEDR